MNIPSDQVGQTSTPPAQATTWQALALATSRPPTPSTLNTWWLSLTWRIMSPYSWSSSSPPYSSLSLSYGPSVRIQGIYMSRSLTGWRTTWLKTIISMRWPFPHYSIAFFWFKEDTYCHQVVVQTGNMLSHGTESKVQMILTGEENATQVRTLSDPQKPAFFKKGCLDAFLMSVDKPLGHLQYLQVIKAFSLIHKQHIQWTYREMCNAQPSLYKYRILAYTCIKCFFVSIK